QLYCLRETADVMKRLSQHPHRPNGGWVVLTDPCFRKLQELLAELHLFLVMVWLIICHREPVHTSEAVRVVRAKLGFLALERLLLHGYPLGDSTGPTEPPGDLCHD